MSAAWVAVVVTLSIAVAALTVAFVIHARKVTVVLDRVDAWLARPDVRPPGLQPGSRVLPFTALKQDGRSFSDRDLIGQRSMVLFMKSECVTCRRLAQQLSRRALDALAIGDTTYVVLRDEYERDALALDGALEIAFQADGVVAWAFRSSATPQAFVVNDNGIVTASGFPNTLEQMQALFRRADWELISA